jgi:hypothetical protein
MEAQGSWGELLAALETAKEYVEGRLEEIRDE